MLPRNDVLPEELPLALRKTERRFMAAHTAVGVVLGCGMLSFVVLGATVVFAILLADVCVVAGLQIWLVCLRKRYRRLIDEHDGLLCERCAYPIGSIPHDETGFVHCPECGQAVCKGEVAKMWRQACAKLR